MEDSGSRSRGGVRPDKSSNWGQWRSVGESRGRSEGWSLVIVGCERRWLRGLTEPRVDEECRVERSGRSMSMLSLVTDRLVPSV